MKTMQRIGSSTEPGVEAHKPADLRTVSIPEEGFNSATLKMCGAMAILSTISIFRSECGESPVSDSLLGEALGGVQELIAAAYEEL